MKRTAAYLVIALLLSPGCSSEHRKAVAPTTEQDLTVTFGGFLKGGDEHEKLDGICAPDLTRTQLTCDVHNGLRRWKITQLTISVSWFPYSENDVMDYAQRVSIPPLNTAHVTLRLGTVLPDDTNIRGNAMKHWAWLIRGAKGIQTGAGAE